MKNEIDIYDRIFKYVIRVVCLARKLPKNPIYLKMYGQLMNASTSVGANSEEASAAESKADFIHKWCISRKELRESNYWLRIIKYSEIFLTEENKAELENLLKESSEMLLVITSIILTTRKNIEKKNK